MRGTYRDRKEPTDEYVNRALFNPFGENNIDIRGELDDIYIGGWFSGGWFPADIWWGEGNTT